MVNNDGTIIRRGPGETFQQTLDRLFSPARTSAMLELVSPQITSAQSYYVSTIVQPSKVMMHTIEDGTHASDDEEEETQEARCEEDLDELSVDELQLMVRMLSIR